MNRINPIGCLNSFAINLYDYEYKQIIRKLAQYGISPTGNKASDKAKLHEIELKQLNMCNDINFDFLTISKDEQQKIQKNKKYNKINYSSDININLTAGQEILGEQILIIIKMKDKNNI